MKILYLQVQVISGSDPITIRAKLRNALPRAPEKQLVRVRTIQFHFNPFKRNSK